jgi:hypothetical protein
MPITQAQSNISSEAGAIARDAEKTQDIAIPPAVEALRCGLLALAQARELRAGACPLAAMAA